MHRIDCFVLTCSVALVASACGESSTDGSSQPSDCNFDSTFAAIQTTIFEGEGCASDACHGASFESSGGLDLRANASYGSLVRVASSVNSEIERVFPGDQERSLLYRKLRETTQELANAGLGQAMPSGLPQLSDDKIEAVLLWMRAGAPEDAVVEGTLNLLGCEGNFEADPNKIDPLPAPAPGEGVQFYAGGWALGAEAEDEVCYATYYDFSDAVPPEYQVDCDEFGEGRRCFAFGRSELAQDGQSHHSIITVYTPESDPNGGGWGPWACLGGATDGQSCDPTDPGACGERAACATPARTSVACIGYPHAPSDFSDFGASAIGGVSGTRAGLSGAQESTFIDQPQEGVYSRLPLQGFVSWNSHGFNLTTKNTSIEQWVNVSFVPEQSRNWLNRQIFEAREIFAMSTVAPFTKREVCMTFTLPQYSRLMSLSSHMHQKGELFRIWLPPNQPCEGSDGCAVPQSEADYVSRLYDDPVYTYYDPPLEYDGEGDPERTFRACAVYDNGADNPAEVKRESTKPDTPTCGFPVAHCGCAEKDRACFGGPNEGMSCGGDDSVCGDGGLCDACPVWGGITTADEMFIPLGSYFVQPPSP
ncbi:MAG: hypothetical protein OER77_18265 [Myxococcales bacterium]|nr:hypothetical protein [Myxococcales bacterium]